MWFIGVEVEQETSAPSPKKKSWIRPCKPFTCKPFSLNIPIVLQQQDCTLLVLNITVL